MNFETARTSDKLRFLASKLRTRRTRRLFHQGSYERCTVGLGNRLRSSGRLGSAGSEGRYAFADKYGVTVSEASALFYGEYGKLRIGMRKNRLSSYRGFTASLAADVLELLAFKYELKGK